MRRLAILISVLLLSAELLTAQVRPIYNRGAAGLELLLGRLQTTASALHTGAHPDDEDSALISRLARGDYARVAYLALNRGEGGQNIIGTELFEALGVIRTEELLQARRLDGGDQFFTRTMDYGFSKTRDEAAAHGRALRRAILCHQRRYGHRCGKYDDSGDESESKCVCHEKPP